MIARQSVVGGWALALSILLQLTMTSCTQPDSSKDMTEIELNTFLDLPFPHQVLGQEMVTLPEPGASGIPGPTDYVVLVAAVRSEEAVLDAFLSNSASIAPPEGVHPQFIRDWLDRPQQTALSSIGERQTVADLSTYLKRPAKRAVAVPANDSELVIYIEFVSP